MTDTIAELRALLAKATGGPWRVWSGGGSVRAPYNRISENGAEQVGFTRVAFGHDGAAKARDVDYALIVAMRNSIEALLDRVEAGERAIDFLDMRRPIKGIEYRSAEEVFAIMADRIRLAEAGHYRLPPAQQKADTP
jgi:hypothetical protein